MLFVRPRYYRELTLQQFLRGKRPVRRRRFPKRQISRERHLMEIYQKCPALYREWTKPTYEQRVVRQGYPMERFPSPRFIDQLRAVPTAVPKRLWHDTESERPAWCALWRYTGRCVWLPLRIPRCSHTEERVWRQAELDMAWCAPTVSERQRALREYAHRLGWEDDSLDRYLGGDWSRPFYRSDPRKWVAIYYEELLNLPIHASLGYFGDPRLQAGFLPFLQNRSYRAMEFTLLKLYQPHATHGAMRPTAWLTRWLERVRRNAQRLAALEPENEQQRRLVELFQEPNRTNGRDQSRV